MPRERRGGYIMWAKTDRCRADWDLRHARRQVKQALARNVAADELFRLLHFELLAATDVADYEARRQSGPVAR